MEGIGEDADREGLIETPDRIARMCEEIYGGYEEDAKSIFVRRFMWKQRYGRRKRYYVLFHVRASLLPFYGKAHIAYIPERKVAGLASCET